MEIQMLIETIKVLLIMLSGIIAYEVLKTVLHRKTNRSKELTCSEVENYLKSIGNRYEGATEIMLNPMLLENEELEKPVYLKRSE